MQANEPSRAVFVSDVHSNLEALEAVLEEAGGLRVFCAGDVVGYGASPNEVVGLLRRVGATCVQGNHDRAAVTGDVRGFNPTAGMAAVWTSRQLTDESRGFLAALPTGARGTVGGRSLYMVHGSPDDPLWEYVLPSTHADLLDHYLGKVGADVLALGHTHAPFEWRGEGLVFNPGSVGQPRDGDPRASYAVLCAEGGRVEVELRRVECDVERSARKVLASGLPPSLSSRLLSGR